AVATDGKAGVAALCGRRLLHSEDNGQHFAASAAPAGSRHVVWHDGRAQATRAEGGVRRDRRWAGRFADRGAWISDDGGASWAELADAVAYDLMDVIPDGAGGAFAWTSVGLVHLQPDEPVAAGAEGSTWIPRFDLSFRYDQIDGFSAA